jgi:hypothetical protein
MYIHLYKQRVFGIVIVWWGYGMVFHATFDNISVISWWSVLLAEETGIPGENYRPAAMSLLVILSVITVLTANIILKQIT